MGVHKVVLLSAILLFSSICLAQRREESSSSSSSSASGGGASYDRGSYSSSTSDRSYSSSNERSSSSPSGRGASSSSERSSSSSSSERSRDSSSKHASGDSGVRNNGHDGARPSLYHYGAREIWDKNSERRAEFDRHDDTVVINSLSAPNERQVMANIRRDEEELKREAKRDDKKPSLTKKSAMSNNDRYFKAVADCRKMHGYFINGQCWDSVVAAEGYFADGTYRCIRFPDQFDWRALLERRMQYACSPRGDPAECARLKQQLQSLPADSSSCRWRWVAQP